MLLLINNFLKTFINFYSVFIFLLNFEKFKSCTTQKDCFNCTMFSQLDTNCKWNSYKCESSEKFDTKKNWWEYFESCVLDSASYNQMRIYCGGLLERSPPFEVKLTNYTNQFATKNLYCRWNVINLDVKKLIKINFTKLNPSLEDQYAMEIIDEKGISSINNLQTKSYNLIVQNANNIYIHYFTTSKEKSNLPFEIFFEYQIETETNYLSLLIALGTTIFVCVFCSILFYKCSKVIIDNRNRNFQEENRININNILSNNIENIHTEVLRENTIKQKNHRKLESLFRNELRPLKYAKSLNEFKGNCSICLENFKSTSHVIKLLCKHLFHFHCIKNWCDKTILNPKCPNCNLEVLHQEENEVSILRLTRSRSAMNIIENFSRDDDDSSNNNNNSFRINSINGEGDNINRNEINNENLNNENNNINSEDQNQQSIITNVVDVQSVPIVNRMFSSNRDINNNLQFIESDTQRNNFITRDNNVTNLNER